MCYLVGYSCAESGAAAGGAGHKGAAARKGRRAGYINEYIANAKRLINNPAARQNLSAKTKEAMSHNPPFLDTKKYSELFEDCLNTIIAEHPRA